MDDRALLNQYLADRDERAFAELVRRHVDMVYSAARRQVKDPSAAQDVTQHVFVRLAQKGGTIRDREALAGWLLTSTRFAALDWLRAESRRRHHETEAAAMKQELFGESPDATAEWESIRPVLDEAMSLLRPRDRDVLALRYFRKLSLADVAAELGITTDAANKRIERATDRLRKLFARRGVTTTGQMLSASLGAYAVTTAPVELAGQIAQQAIAVSGAAAGTSLSMTKGAVLLMAATKTQIGIATGLAAALAAVAIPVAYMNLPASPPPTAPALIGGSSETGISGVFIPTTAPNPKARLNEVYALAPAQNARRILPPFIAERDDAITDNGKSAPSPLRMESAAVFGWNGHAAQWKSSWIGGSMSVGEAFRAVTGAWPQDTDIPRDVLIAKLPGDWVVRDGATTESRILDFLRGAGDILGAGMILRQEPIEREVIVVRGTLELARTRVSREEGPGHKLVIAPDGPQKITRVAQSPREMLKIVGEMMARPVLIEAEVDRENEPYWIHSQQSANFGASVEVPAGAVIDPYLARVAEQTGLELKREQRIVPTWRLVPAGL